MPLLLIDMGVFFYGGKDSIDWWGEEFSSFPVRFIDSSEELLKSLESDVAKLVFLDFDYNTEETVALDKKISSMGVVRIVFSTDTGTLKEYQKSKKCGPWLYEKAFDEGNGRRDCW